MTSDRASEEWTITCQCKNTVLSGHGKPIQVAICHCADCRAAQGGEAPTEILALIRRDQVESKLDELKVVPADEYNDKVPRYFCKSCNSCLVGDCTPIGFDMAIVPTARMSSGGQLRDPDYHMHLRDATVNPDDDGLPRYQADPEDPHMAALIGGCS